jgi:hypothetical protein
MVVENNDRDEFGRDASERIVELSPRDAEYINREVEAGKHETYDDALSYVIARGLAEIKRQRDAAEANRAKSLLKAKADTWKKLLELNPALIADPNVMSRMLSELGIAKQGS